MTQKMSPGKFLPFCNLCFPHKTADTTKNIFKKKFLQKGTNANYEIKGYYK
jgi:hypothetical protein